MLPKWYRRGTEEPNKQWANSARRGLSEGKDNILERNIKDGMRKSGMVGMVGKRGRNGEWREENGISTSTHMNEEEIDREKYVDMMSEGGGRGKGGIIC